MGGGITDMKLIKIIDSLINILPGIHHTRPVANLWPLQSLALKQLKPGH